MTEIEVTNVVEHENGDATYVFEMDNDSAKIATELGLKLLFYCGACEVSTQEVFDELLQKAKNREVEVEETIAGRYEMSMPGEKDYEV
jgi:hypothetical protein